MRIEFVASLGQRLERFLLVAGSDLVFLPGIVNLQKTGRRRVLPTQANANVDTPRLGLDVAIRIFLAIKLIQPKRTIILIPIIAAYRTVQSERRPIGERVTNRLL